MQNDTDNNHADLPADIGTQLQNLEARHARHQAMLERHHEDKHRAREKHRQKWHVGGHKVSGIPIVLR